MASKRVRSYGVGPSIMYFTLDVSQTITKGMALVIDGSTNVVQAAGDAAGAGTVVGYAAEDKTTGAADTTTLIAVDIDPQAVYNMPYIGAAPVLGISYDVGTNAGVADGDDSTGGIFTCVGNIDTTAKTADFILINRFNAKG